MRKEIVAPHVEARRSTRDGWLDIEQQASVKLTSEDASHPIESVFREGDGPGWRAAEPGHQTIRLRFDAPQRLQKIRLVFHEHRTARTQEFVLRWAAEDGSWREIVRQQYTFSPPGTTRQVEEYTLDLNGVTALELAITPDIHGTESYASLWEWSVA